ncbi:MAG: hypothetical protein DPW09_05930 [Anaerolineae bacterium]|nr:helix-turn-helix domain-containing protein [Anaerolineae bacterium]MCQ3972975.1 hypothetical protein [Anaerolineae bacterium]
MLDENLSHGYFSPHDPSLIFIQSRVKLNQTAIEKYADKMSHGVQFEAVKAIQDSDGTLYVWDGYHRGEAAKLACVELLVEFRPGTRREAEWESLGANKLHGLQRTSEDEDKVVRQALLDFPEQSIRKINEHTGVDRRRIARIRQELIEAGAIADSGDEVVVERKGQVYRQKVHRKDSPTVAANQAEGAIVLSTTSQEETALNQETRFPNIQLGEFDCPRCLIQQVVHRNGGAWCLACDAKWNKLDEFDAERLKLQSGSAARVHSVSTHNNLTLSSKASPTSPELLRHQVQDLAGQLISQISESHLSELEKRLRALAEEFGVELTTVQRNERI